MRRLALSLLAVLALTGLAACGGSATPSPASSAAANPSTPASSTGAGSSTAAGASTGAGSSTGGGAACALAASAGTAATVNVSIKDFKFNPQPVEAKVGDTVAWKNDDAAPHSATMDDGSCDTDTIASGASAMLVFTAPGTYTYHCKIHPGQMKGFTVEVK